MKYLITRILKENQAAFAAARNAAQAAARNAALNAAFEVYHRTQDKSLAQKAADIYWFMATYLSKGT